MKKVGLTGNIGSGKTTVSHILQILGIPIYNADKQAKLMMLRELLRSQLIDCFGENVFRDDALDRHYLSQIVFNDPEKLILNGLVHPHVNYF